MDKMATFSVNKHRKSIKKAAKIIRNGGIVAFPTETVYGLGADAFNPIAVAKIFEVKNRPSFDPLIVHISDFKMANLLWKEIDERAKLLMEKFWPGPLTIVLPKKKEVPDIVTAGLPTVAVRMPSHPIAHELIKESKTPIAAPSANPFGYISPTTAKHVHKQLGSKVDWIIDGGKCPIGVESTVIDLTTDKAKLLRPGGMPLEDIEKVIGSIEVASSETIINEYNPKSPGQLRRHYSPRTPIILIEQGNLPEDIPPHSGYIGLKPLNEAREKLPFKVVKYLSKNGNLKEAAANLFYILHELDEENLECIYAEIIEEKGLGRAIMDRLKRAKGL
ncbi:MAG: L-threonylcarbamoyladenylate synthase [Promethearchaeota archaeon]